MQRLAKRNNRLQHRWRQRFHWRVGPKEGLNMGVDLAQRLIARWSDMKPGLKEQAGTLTESRLRELADGHVETCLIPQGFQ